MAWERAVVHRSVLPALAKVNVASAVYLAFTLYADEDGSSAFPSLHGLARSLGVDHRSVQRAVRSLEAAGLLVHQGQASRLVRSYRVVKSMPTSGKSAAITSGKNGKKPPQLAARLPPNHTKTPEPYTTQDAPSGRGVVSLRSRLRVDQDPPFGRGEPRSARQDQEAASPPATREEAASVVSMKLAGLYPSVPEPARSRSLLALHRRYTARWPHSRPALWIEVAPIAASRASGPVVSPAAWATAHIEGYAGSWLPQAPSGSTIPAHQALLDGRLHDAWSILKNKAAAS